MDTARYVEKIATLFGKIVARMQLDSEADSLGLTASQVQGLSYLFHHGQKSVGEVSRGLGISHPAAVKMIDRLRKKGFASRVEKSDDRRVSLIELTEQGREIVERILSRRTEVLAASLGRLDQKQMEDVLRGLETLLASALEDQSMVESACLRCGDDHIGCCIINRTHLELTGITIERT